jgi:antibiotic biosynthesis monooxygenase (ABM) superfamily enzyme
MSASLITASGRAVRRNLYPLFNTPSSKLFAFKRVYDVVGAACSIIVMNYFFIPFMLREFQPSVSIWIDTWFFGHVVTLICIGTLEYAGVGKKLRNKYIPKEETKKE